VNNSNGNAMPLGGNVVCHQYAVVIIPLAAGDAFGVKLKFTSIESDENDLALVHLTMTLF
jgi:hypothetical protein